MSSGYELPVRIGRLLIVACCILIFVGSCKEKDPRFISISEGVFVQGDTTFFPIMLNYVGQYYEHTNGVSFGPVAYYNLPENRNNPSSEVLAAETNAQIEYIRSMGFNSIRLCYDRISDHDGMLGYKAGNKFLTLDQDAKELIQALKGFIDICKAHDVKVMLLIRRPLGEIQIENFTNQLLAEFSDEPILFSYDFFNEPLYSEEGRILTKEDAIRISRGWRKQMDTYAPNQLLTVGSSEPIEVFRWDPSMLDVDFISFHTYNPMRIPNEIYWYSNFVNKPWMIGETSLGAGEDSVSFEMQSRFVDEVAHRVVNCGGIGLGWWEYMDLSESPFFEARRSGLLTDSGRTTTPSGKVVFGIPKPATTKFSKLDKLKKNGNCDCMDNYKNMVGYQNYRTDFQILDSTTHKPIEGALIRGWNIDFSIGQNTYSDSTGRATLYSNDKVAQFEISAPGKRLHKFYNPFPCESLLDDAIPEDSLPNIKLEYQKISFLHLISSDKTEIKDNFTGNYQFFDYKEGLFDKAHYRCDGGTFYLSDQDDGKPFWEF